MENENVQKSYYAIIPADIRYDSELSANAKLLYGEITALANEKGYCWASNNYFADLYKVTKKSISNWLTQLESKGYIKRTVITDGKEIKERRIYISTLGIEYEEDKEKEEKIFDTYRKDFPYPVEKKVMGVGKKTSYPMEKKVTGNNTINNTFNNTEDRENTSELDKIVEAWNKTGCLKIRTLSKTRISQLEQRIKESGIDVVLEAINLVKNSDFLKGDNDRAWIANFDFFIKQSNLNKILEGQYNNKTKKTKFHNFEQATDSMSEQDLEDIAKRKREQALKEFGI